MEKSFVSSKNPLQMYSVKLFLPLVCKIAERGTLCHISLHSHRMSPIPIVMGPMQKFLQKPLSIWNSSVLQN